jgi:regulator of nucleoside diphosphate kinase
MNMSTEQRASSYGNKPRILISRVDQDRLSKLAHAVADRLPEVSEDLLVELDRADLVDAEELPPGVVRMGSTVEYRSDDSQDRRVTLVYPGEADITLGRISILTPIGTALIGLSVGQSIDWTARDERRHRLVVVTVDGPQSSARAGG